MSPPAQFIPNPVGCAIVGFAFVLVSAVLIVAGTKLGGRFARRQKGLEVTTHRSAGHEGAGTGGEPPRGE